MKPRSVTTTFTFRDANVRTVIIDRTPWFVAGDVAEILGYRDAANMVRRLDEDERGTHTLSTLGGTQSVTVITESGLYSAILTDTSHPDRGGRRAPRSVQEHPRAD